eukprot:633099-Pelagomonas_calceolata.AAC.1
MPLIHPQGRSLLLLPHLLPMCQCQGIAVSMPFYYATGSKYKALLFGTLAGFPLPLGGLINVDVSLDSVAFDFFQACVCLKWQYVQAALRLGIWPVEDARLALILHLPLSNTPEA